MRILAIGQRRTIRRNDKNRMQSAITDCSGAGSPASTACDLTIAVVALVLAFGATKIGFQSSASEPFFRPFSIIYFSIGAFARFGVIGNRAGIALRASRTELFHKSSGNTWRFFRPRDAAAAAAADNIYCAFPDAQPRAKSLFFPLSPALPPNERN